MPLCKVTGCRNNTDGKRQHPICLECYEVAVNVPANQFLDNLSPYLQIDGTCIQRDCKKNLMICQRQENTWQVAPVCNKCYMECSKSYGSSALHEWQIIVTLHPDGRLSFSW